MSGISFKLLVLLEEGAAGRVRRAAMFMKCAGTFEGSSLKEDRWFGELAMWYQAFHLEVARFKSSLGRGWHWAISIKWLFGVAWEKWLVRLSPHGAGGFASWSVSEDVWEDKEWECLMHGMGRRHWILIPWHGPGTWRQFSKPREVATMGVLLCQHPIF